MRWQYKLLCGVVGACMYISLPPGWYFTIHNCARFDRLQKQLRESTSYDSVLVREIGESYAKLFKHVIQDIRNHSDSVSDTVVISSKGFEGILQKQTTPPAYQMHY